VGGRKGKEGRGRKEKGKRETEGRKSKEEQCRKGGGERERNE
jgi:hypothetical protein